jgi:hypothetical protein
MGKNRVCVKCVGKIMEVRGLARALRLAGLLLLLGRLARLLKFPLHLLVKLRRIIDRASGKGG